VIEPCLAIRTADGGGRDGCDDIATRRGGVGGGLGWSEGFFSFLLQ
jgi:hypothetical protein